MGFVLHKIVTKRRAFRLTIRIVRRNALEKDKITISIDSLEVLIVHSKKRKLPCVSSVFVWFLSQRVRVIDEVIGYEVSREGKRDR